MPVAAVGCFGLIKKTLWSYLLTSEMKSILFATVEVCFNPHTHVGCDSISNNIL